jgi:hypothetical protein
MKTFFLSITVTISSCILWMSCDKDEPESQVLVFSASGDITNKLQEFRQKLGSLNTVPGNTGGRREINWDAVPDSFETVNLPTDFFNPLGPGASPGLQRGLLYLPGASARVSNNAFASFEPANATEFHAFSGIKTFAAVGSNLWNVEFAVPGQSMAASVKGFGAVFSDVDTEGSASMQFFSGAESLGTFKVPAKTIGSFSFLGVYFQNKKITRVQIKQGAAAIGVSVKDVSVGGAQDLVVMDDFIYSEPIAN